MGDPPDGMWLERVNNDKGYNPANCIWATPRAQNNNRRKKLVIEFDGKSLSVAEWARIVKIHKQTLYSRVKMGWPAVQILTLAPSLLERRYR